ncbi:GNAT family N-acetyltransferase [Aquimarina gracilis]|uniref:GNAT family N-acetyltransferase n=1 Tax=Aquimarina gracilis TaxID=874422 RepID=A0ABU5ZWG8_9FLAO|nr:GNAT family N-acetyltransferase [Aquimarina gracilis]MEB3346219.1 GNAT family N-acetyltransferase [Aquimarina gracilis]
MIQIQKVNNTLEFETIEKLAFEILHEVYDPIIPSAHTEYFLKKFQSASVIKNQIKNEDFRYFLLNFNKLHVGYLGIQKNKEKLILSKLYIRKSFRGKKIGKVALEFVQQYTIENRFKKIELIVNQQNQDTINIYQKFGFKITESMVNSFPNGHFVRDYKMEKIV